MRILIIAVSLLTTGVLGSSASLPSPRVAAPSDTLVLRVNSPGGRPAFFSGVLITGDTGSTRRFVHQQTPFEVRLPTAALHAMIRGDDGALVQAETFIQSGGRRGASATGRSAGTMMLFAHRDGQVGFAPL